LVKSSECRASRDRLEVKQRETSGKRQRKQRKKRNRNREGRDTEIVRKGERPMKEYEIEYENERETDREIYKQKEKEGL